MAPNPVPESLEIAEAAREKVWKQPSFVAELFMGRFLIDLISPYPKQSEEDKKALEAHLKPMQSFLKEHLDPDQVDRTGEIPQETIKGLARLGCFGIKIPKKYGGLGLSQTNYNRIIAMVSSYCGSTAVWLSAHQSIGAPQPLLMFGTEEQKNKYLPRLAVGAVSAFALTEPDVGSDPANMKTTATPIESGNYYLINGEKLWCTNAPVAEIIVVMAQTPPVIQNGKERKQITAFILERSMPGVDVPHRCQFLGLNGIQNGILRFKDVKVPKENIIWGLGQGLKLALITLNTGRMTLPAACLGASQKCLQISREWSNIRKQWGMPIGKHEAVAAKLSNMTSDVFAMDAMVWLASSMVDLKTYDFRLEAAIAKMFCSEISWRIADDTLQVRGGRGYERADSLKGRGEEVKPVERILRECRINRIIEGTSEIMRLFIAREALDRHMDLVGPIMDPKTPIGIKTKLMAKAFGFYSIWWPKQILGMLLVPRYRKFQSLSKHMRFVHRTSHRLALALFHSAARYQAKLAYKQQLLARLVDIGAYLFAIAACCSKAQSMLEENPSDKTPLELADLFSRLSKTKIDEAFRRLGDKDDARSYRLAQNLLSSKYLWLEEGII